MIQTPEKKWGLRAKPKKLNKSLGIHIIHPVQNANTRSRVEQLGTEVFGNSKIVEVLGCSETTATSYIKRMCDELHIIYAVEGSGKGKYVFRQ